MTSKQEAVAAFVDEHVTWLPRAHAQLAGMPPPPIYDQHWRPLQRPTAEQLGKQLAEMAKFRALGLANWLNTPEGQVIAEGVQMLSPPLYRQDEQLVIDGLKYAASLQQQDGQETTGRVALGAICVGVLTAFAVAGSRH